jgi:hypothetical protein
LAPIHQQRDRRCRIVQDRVDEGAPVAGTIILPNLAYVPTAADDARSKEAHRRTASAHSKRRSPRSGCRVTRRVTGNPALMRASRDASVCPSEQLHHEKSIAGVIADVVERADVGMI